MKTSWTQGLDPELKKEIVGDFKSSLLTRKRLAKLLSDKIDAADKASLNKNDYETANWAYKQADTVGYKRAMNEIINLILEDE